MTTIDFAKAKAERTPHITGKAKCTACKHEWVAVAPVGTLQMECPSCELQRGQWIYPFSPAEGEQIFVCNICTSTNFAVLPDRVLCVGCGTSHQPWEQRV